MRLVRRILKISLGGGNVQFIIYKELVLEIYWVRSNGS